jgi:hypothetical protein
MQEMWLLAGQHVALDWRQGALKGMATPKKSVNFFELDEQQVEHEKREQRFRVRQGNSVVEHEGLATET